MCQVYDTILSGQIPDGWAIFRATNAHTNISSRITFNMQELCYIMLYKLYIIFAYCVSQIIVQSLARAELKSDGLEIQGKAGPGNSIKRSSLHSIYVPDLKQMLVILATPTNLMALLLHCSSNAGPGGSVTKQPTCGQYFCSI